MLNILKRPTIYLSCLSMALIALVKQRYPIGGVNQNQAFS